VPPSERSSRDFSNSFAIFQAVGAGHGELGLDFP
jgi:hypothetical protein